MIPIDQIRELAHRDRKTRVQATLKLLEELGELSRLVLIDDRAHGTTYRRCEREYLLEEAADVLICTFALLEKLELSDEDLEPWLHRKMGKWARLIENAPPSDAFTHSPKDPK